MCECPAGFPQILAHIAVSRNDLEATIFKLCNVTDDVATYVGSGSSDIDQDADSANDHDQDVGSSEPEVLIETNAGSVWIMILLIGIGTICGAIIMLVCLSRVCKTHFRGPVNQGSSAGAPLKPGQMDRPSCKSTVDTSETLSDL
jgi:hypothetical protein